MRKIFYLPLGKMVATAHCPIILWVRLRNWPSPIYLSNKNLKKLGCRDNQIIFFVLTMEHWYKTVQSAIEGKEQATLYQNDQYTDLFLHDLKSLGLLDN